MKFRMTIWALALLLVGTLNSCEEDEVVAEVFPDKIGVNSSALRPEGIDYDKERNRFLLGSTLQGKVLAVDKNGTFSTFIDDSALSAVIGVHIDVPRNRVLVCNSNISTYDVAQLGVYNLETGARIALVDFADVSPASAFNFANDATVDFSGNIYVTDSGANVVYKVDGNYNPSLYVSNDGYEFLNGIEFIDYILLFADMDTGNLYRKDTRDGSVATEVVLGEETGGLDGIMRNYNRGLTGVSVENRLVKLGSSDNWQTASVVKAADLSTRASTVTQVSETEYFVCEPQFDQPDHSGISQYNLSKVVF